MPAQFSYNLNLSGESSLYLIFALLYWLMDMDTVQLMYDGEGLVDIVQMK